MCLRLRNLGLRPSDSLAATAHFISWNDATVHDVLFMSSPEPDFFDQQVKQYYPA
jgi:hypothetical protein